MAPLYNPSGSASSSSGGGGIPTDGRDGEADLDGVNLVPWCTLVGSTYTMQRAGLPRTFRLRQGITFNPNNIEGPFATGDWLVEGTIDVTGANAVGAVAGAVLAAQTLPANVSGGTGGAPGANGTQATASTTEGPTGGRLGSAAGGAGVANAGGVAPVVTSLGITRGVTHGGAAALGSGQFWSQLGVTSESGGVGGSGGGGGAGSGGGGGAAGRRAYFKGRNLVVTSTGTINANGGNGAAGGVGAGGGSGGSGGRMTFDFQSITVSDPYASIQVRGGGSGAPGDATARYGNCGLTGDLIFLNAWPNALGTIMTRRAMPSSEYSAAIAGGKLDYSFSFVMGSDCGQSTGAASNSTGGGGLSICEFVTPDGLAALRFNASTVALDLYVRGVVVLSTPDVNVSALAGPTFMPWRAGDRVQGRIWHDPTGTPGARSMGIRWSVNRCSGLDTVGVAAGANLNAATSGSTYGTGETPSSFILQSIAANIVGTIVLCGDSIIASRKNSVGWDGMTVGSLLGLSTQWCISLALQGATIATQKTAWDASPMKGDASLVAFVDQCGHNDINAGRTAAQVTTDTQAFIDDNLASNPTCKRIISKLSPSVSNQDLAGTLAVWNAVQANFDGSGGTPIINVDARATIHTASMGDANLVLKDRSEASDFTHPCWYGRGRNAQSIAAALVAAGVTL